MVSSVLAPLLLDIGFAELLWSFLIVFFMITFFVILFHVVVDIFRSHDLSGVAKMLWLILIVFLPFVGMFIYLVVHGSGMAARQAKAVSDREAAFDDYARGVAGGSAAEIARGKELLDGGSITPAEFDAIKQKALS